ncbi:Rhomboid protease GluP [Thalassovita gelatinovora]|uniref:Rhomboid protease GluP n=1 Tax=Thalassovita gelatinovora TaxID=53501 RepID=A0A0P1FCD0_THAGE|nr:rhomboid family intramembrane serine protease [Thalassovita gelatinovora]QIZ82482.1 rhomboid family intramembrane serine protease [Thalassovita gelatinovora]CUH65747.1 Rhomboid protease GluP [Thalassovita gelatinovora]SER03952.1 Membrane associated serine protease, rhomboid family [Thalassovita gelatinovora]
MLPIRDHNPSERTPYVTYALIVVNVLVFFSYVGLFSDQRALASFFDTWALIPARVAQGQDMITLFTTMFMHGGFMHLAGNMLFLWIFGDNLEDEMGHIGYLLFYLASGLAAALTHVIAAPYSDVPTVGASGAIAGVMGGYLLLYPKARIDILFIFIIFIRIFSVPAWVMLGFWFLLQLVSGTGADAMAGGVAYWAHAGGFIAGFVLTLPIWLRQGGARYWNQNQGRPPHPETRYELTPTQIPRVRRRK